MLLQAAVGQTFLLQSADACHRCHCCWERCKQPYVHLDRSGGISSQLYKSKLLKFTIFHKQEHQAPIVDSKDVDRILEQQRPPQKPAPNHPWRKSVISNQKVNPVFLLSLAVDNWAVLFCPIIHSHYDYAVLDQKGIFLLWVDMGYFKCFHRGVHRYPVSD